MAKGTTIFIIILTSLAFLLLGINIGKRLPKFDQENSSGQAQPTPFPTNTPIPSPTISFLPSSSTTSATKKPKTKSLSTYQDKTCGFSVSYPSSFLSTKTVNNNSFILADPDNEKEAIAATCAEVIPKPPVTSDKIEAIKLDGVPATLYHDSYSDGSPRDEFIVKHPKTGIEIIIAGFGESFKQATTSFKFL